MNKYINFLLTIQEMGRPIRAVSSINKKSLNSKLHSIAKTLHTIVRKAPCGEWNTESREDFLRRNLSRCFLPLILVISNFVLKIQIYIFMYSKGKKDYVQCLLCARHLIDLSLIFTRTLGSSYYYQLHFTNVNNETKNSPKITWQISDKADFHMWV